jgi:hypothetical protein
MASPEQIGMSLEEGPRVKHERPRLTQDELFGYSEWKHQVPTALRSIVEGKILGQKVRVDQSELPSVAEFYRGAQKLLDDPRADVETLDVSPAVKKQLVALQRVRVGEETINIFSAFADEKIGFDVKNNYAQSKVIPRIEFLRSRDLRLSEQVQKKDEGTNVTGEETEEEYSPHRAPTQESEGLPTEAVATVVPFFGGLYTDAVYDLYDEQTLTWRKSARRFEDVTAQNLESERARTYASVVKCGRGSVKLPRWWGIDKESVLWIKDKPESWDIVRDQDGIIFIKSGDATADYPFQIQIAPSSEAIDLAPPEGECQPACESFPDELCRFADELFATRLSHAAKVRKLASFIRSHLEYDMDPKWDAVYKADPSKYLDAIWTNKKAKCDEANTMLVRMLTKMGVHARFIGGHSVRSKSPHGEAMLLDGNRHAWAMAWDPVENEWLRLDATPAGDPNVNQEEQEADLGEGDYGEQEAELMSEEELEKKLAEFEKAQNEEEEKKDPVLAYAKEAGCTPEEARAVLDKIDELRSRHARVLDDADRQWQRLIRENVRERIEDRGPVPLSQMDEVDPDEIVAGYIEMRAGSKDPLIGMREEVKEKKEKWFGGYEVYIAADMSGSMDATINGVKKVDAQRDMIFLLVDSCMNSSARVKKKTRQLKAPMPVKVSVTVLGNKIEIVLPLTEEWGPKEQIKLYRALDVGAGGGTPDHKALGLIKGQILDSVTDETKARSKKNVLKRHGWKMRRFVIVTADAGSDRPNAVREINKEIEAEGVAVDLFLIAPEEDKNIKTVAEKAYSSVTPVPDVTDLAIKGLECLTRRIKKAYTK